MNVNSFRRQTTVCVQPRQVHALHTWASCCFTLSTLCGETFADRLVGGLGMWTVPDLQNHKQHSRSIVGWRRGGAFYLGFFFGILLAMKGWFSCWNAFLLFHSEIENARRVNVVSFLPAWQGSREGESSVTSFKQIRIKSQVPVSWKIPQKIESRVTIRQFQIPAQCFKRKRFWMWLAEKKVSTKEKNQEWRVMHVKWYSDGKQTQKWLLKWGKCVSVWVWPSKEIPSCRWCRYCSSTGDTSPKSTFRWCRTPVTEFGKVNKIIFHHSVCTVKIYKNISWCFRQNFVAPNSFHEANWKVLLYLGQHVRLLRRFLSVTLNVALSFSFQKIFLFLLLFKPCWKKCVLPVELWKKIGEMPNSGITLVEYFSLLFECCNVIFSLLLSHTYSGRVSARWGLQQPHCVWHKRLTSKWVANWRALVQTSVLLPLNELPVFVAGLSTAEPFGP